MLKLSTFNANGSPKHSFLRFMVEAEVTSSHANWICYVLFFRLKHFGIDCYSAAGQT